MINWLIENAGMIGLFFFFSAFLLVTFWAFRPSAKDTIEAHRFIPLAEDK